MSIRKTSRIFGVVVALLVLDTITVGTASSEEIKLVVPNALENVEGDDFGGFEGVRNWRYQQLFLASEFASLPATHRTIVGLFLRPDASVTEPRTATYGDGFQVQLSTTDKSPNELDIVFDNNLSGDIATAILGSLTISTQATGTPEGPRDFDYFLPFRTPFFYDPTSGKNLILDAIAPTGFSPDVLHDSFTSTSPVAVLNGSNSAARSGSLLNSGFVAQFVFVPEPSTLLMGALGLVGLAGLNMRSRLSSL